MQCDKVKIELPPMAPLQKLRILAAFSEARGDPVSDTTRRHYLRMLQQSACVTNLSLGVQVRPTTPHVRYKPYCISPRKLRREERHRTKSENNENNELAGLVKAVLEARIVEPAEEMAMLKKAKSLESVQVVEEDNGRVLTEVEAVSGCIERLRVNE